MKKCEYCGKEYVKNESDYLKNLSETFRKNLEYLPTCNCLEKKKEAGRTAVLWRSGNRKDFHHCLYSKLPHGERKDSTGNESGAVSQ